ncbi:MAG TPA: ABC transporter permease [Anaerolineaceae bacterium]|jgi:peptide/nickel transport system permease protein|nr:ABC transporter permease [Anaerolineaceae bacterium]HOV31555.1 ABC transporter permease [Anaerolineaceae bacterium]HUM48890.1 ABC transporter permease [Anaerolineaceae bacterium]
MKHTLRQVFHSGKFVAGFCILVALLLLIAIYPLFVKGDPLAIIGQGTFFPPGTYVNTYDSIYAPNTYTLNLKDAAANRIAQRLPEKDREEMKTWLVAYGIPEEQIDVNDIKALLDIWFENYDPNESLGMIYAKQRYYQRLNDSIRNLLSIEGVILAEKNPETGELQEVGIVNQTDYVNINEVANVRVLPLGTDNFGRDVLTELVRATAVSLEIGLVAGVIATLIGLTLGLLAGYIGGWVDDFIMFITNLFTVIPSFVLLILISFSIGQEKRGAVTIAIVIGLTSWVWTTRAVRSQVMSLRNRDHVNLSKLSGHSIFYIITHDIFPYIASYVVMALILQISSAILAEASLSILGLGPRTTDVPTLGLMMNWAMIYQAHIMGRWWAYLPVIIMIALITFSMNLMNTGLDQVFNPTLRE